MDREQTIAIQARSTVYPRCPEAVPDVHEESGNYALGFAKNEDDLHNVQRLRFDVFNLEMCEGLDSSYSKCRDEDDYDAVCHHLLVRDCRSGDIVGTYRMQTQGMADGFYSATEFDLSPLEAEFLPAAVELGRACIASRHRNSRVLFLLWRGLAAYMLHNRKRYFFGCCSLTSQDPAKGVQMHRYLQANDHMDPVWRVRPQPGLECAGSDDPSPDEAVIVPRLLRTYLQYGVKIAGPPAIDRLFKTIDFLAVFDIESIDDRIRRLFLD